MGLLKYSCLGKKKKILIDSYSDNQMDIKRVGGLTSIKIVFDKPNIKFVFLAEVFYVVFDILKADIEEYGNIYRNVRFDFETSSLVGLNIRQEEQGDDQTKPVFSISLNLDNY
jgi:hypothetical protein